MKESIRDKFAIEILQAMITQEPASYLNTAIRAVSTVAREKSNIDPNSPAIELIKSNISAAYIIADLMREIRIQNFSKD